MKVTVIGAGNMGGAIAEGILRNGIVCAGDVTIADPNAACAEKLAAEGYDVKYTADNVSAARGSEIIIVAVKPWLMCGVLGEISSVLDRSRQSVVSIAAGITFEQLDEMLSVGVSGMTPLFRVVPNTAVSIGKSMTFVSSRGVTEEQRNSVLNLFGALGYVEEIEERDIDAVTALASSGIAYAFRYIGAAVKGGMARGLDGGMALRTVLRTVEGAVSLLAATGNDPEKEIIKVTTPGGRTIKGLEEMEKCGFTDAVVKGLLATK